MLVECIDSSDSYRDELTKGLIYNVVATDNKYYHVKDHTKDYGWYETSKFKVAKEFSFIDVLNNIKKKEIYSNGFVRIIKLDDKTMFLDDVPGDISNSTFAHQGKLYNFTQAFKYYLDGKVIVSYKTNRKYKRIDGEDFCLDYHWGKNTKFPIEEINYFWNVEI